MYKDISKINKTNRQKVLEKLKNMIRAELKDIKKNSKKGELGAVEHRYFKSDTSLQSAYVDDSIVGEKTLKEILKKSRADIIIELSLSKNKKILFSKKELLDKKIEEVFLIISCI